MHKVVSYGLLLLAASAPAALAARAESGPATDFSAHIFFSAFSASHAPQGYLGVDIRDVSDEQFATLRVKDHRGAEIVLVDHDAPAGKADLRVHDIVLQMNGQPIDSQDQLRRMLHDTPPGRTITFVVSRDGQQLTITTQMADRGEVERRAWDQHISVPDSPDTADNAAQPAAASAPYTHAGNSFIGALLMSPAYTGAMLEQMSAQLANFFGVPSGAGLLVRSVEPNSPAAAAGMHAGDVVIRANAHTVATTGDWARAVKNSRGQPLSIVVLRDKKEQTLTLIPDSKKRS